MDIGWRAEGRAAGGLANLNPRSRVRFERLVIQDECRSGACGAHEITFRRRRKDRRANRRYQADDDGFRVLDQLVVDRLNDDVGAFRALRN